MEAFFPTTGSGSRIEVSRVAVDSLQLESRLLTTDPSRDGRQRKGKRRKSLRKRETEQRNWRRDSFREYSWAAEVRAQVINGLDDAATRMHLSEGKELAEPLKSIQTRKEGPCDGTVGRVR